MPAPGAEPQDRAAFPAQGPAASPGLTVHKVSPTAAEYRLLSQESSPGLRTRALSPPDSSLDGHTGRSVRFQRINHLLEGFKIPEEMRGPWGGTGQCHGPAPVDPG